MSLLLNYRQRGVRQMLVAGLLLLSMISSLVAAEPKSVEVADGVGDWVVHEETGRVFASLTNGDEVVEFSPSATEVRRFKVGAKPTEMILKGDRLIVACTASPALHVIDLQNNKALGTIPVSAFGVYGLFCSQAPNAYVYCITNLGAAWGESEVLQCDLTTMKVRRQKRSQGWGLAHPVRVAMSQDGRWIIADARGVNIPTRADMLNVDEEEFLFTPGRGHHQDFGPIVSVPGNRYWTLGNQLYSLDLARPLRTFASGTVVVHPRFDLAISRTDRGLALQRFSDSGTIANIPLPTSPAKPARQPGERPRNSVVIPADPTLQVDLKNNLVFYGDQFRGAWVDLTPHAAQFSPLIMVQAPSEVTSLVGRSLNVPVSTVAPVKNTKLTIADGPKSAKLEDGKFTWQPDAENAGFTTVELALQSTDDNRTLDTTKMTIQVTLPKLALGVAAKTMELAPGGRYLVAWGVVPGEESRHPAHTGADELVVVDVQDLKVLARKTFPQGVRCATIDDEFVYVSLNSGNLINRWNRELTESERLFLPATPKQLFPIGPGRLAATADQQLMMIDSKEMKSLPMSTDMTRGDPSRLIRSLGHLEIQLGNRILDTRTGKTKTTTGFMNLPMLTTSVAQQFGATPPNYPAITRWGRTLAGNALTNYKGSRIFSWQGQRITAFSERWPMGILIGPAEGTSGPTTMMELVNLIDGTIVHAAVIDSAKPNQQTRTPSYYGIRNTLIVDNDRALFLMGSHLLAAPIPQRIAEAMPMPAHFVLPQRAEIDSEQPVTWKLATAGRTEGVEFNLLNEYAGLSLNRQTGEVTVDTPRLWEQFVQLAVNNGQKSLWIGLPDQTKSYKELTGKELPEDKFVAQLPISVSLQDPEGQEDGIQFGVLVVGPRKPFEEALTARRTEQARQLMLRQEEQKAKEAAKQQEITNSVGERFDALEGRLRRLEAALESVLKKLDERKPE